MNIGASIKHCREQKLISQKDLAELSGVSVSHLCLIENGKRDPSISTIESLSKAMQLPVSVLIFLSTETGDIDEIKSVNIAKLTSLVEKLISKSAKKST